MVILEKTLLWYVVNMLFIKCIFLEVNFKIFSAFWIIKKNSSTFLSHKKFFELHTTKDELNFSIIKILKKRLENYLLLSVNKLDWSLLVELNWQTNLVKIKCHNILIDQAPNNCDEKFDVEFFLSIFNKSLEFMNISSLFLSASLLEFVSNTQMHEY